MPDHADQVVSFSRHISEHTECSSIIWGEGFAAVQSGLSVSVQNVLVWAQQIVQNSFFFSSEIDKKKTRLDLVRGEEMLAWRLQQKFYECCGVTLMWFKGREAEMKQSVLDRNATLARDVLRRKHKKKRGQYRSSLEMRAAKKRRKKNKQIFLSNLRKQREKSKWIVWANIYFCVFPNKLQLSLQVYWVYSLILSTKLPSVEPWPSVSSNHFSFIHLTGNTGGYRLVLWEEISDKHRRRSRS